MKLPMNGNFQVQHLSKLNNRFNEIFNVYYNIFASRDRNWLYFVNIKYYISISMSKNATVNTAPGILELIFQKNDVVLIPEKKNEKFKVIMETLDYLNNKMEEFKSLIERDDLAQSRNELEDIPSIPNLKGQISELLLKDGQSTAIQKIFSHVPQGFNNIQQETPYRFYQIPVEVYPFENSLTLHDHSLEMSVVITDQQVYEYLNKFDAIEKFPTDIRKLINKLSLSAGSSHFHQIPIGIQEENSIHELNSKRYQLPIEMNIFEHAQLSDNPETKHIETQTHLLPLKNLQNYSIDAKSSEGDLSEIDDTVQRIKGMMEHLSRKGSSLSSLNNSVLDLESEKNQNQEKIITTGKYNGQNKCFRGQQNQNEKNKYHNLKEIYEIPIEMEIIHEVPEYKNCYFDFRVCEVTIGYGFSQRNEQTFIKSLDMLNFEEEGQKLTNIPKLNKNFPQFSKNHIEKPMKKSNNRSIGPICEKESEQSKTPIYVLPDGTSSDSSKTEQELYFSRIREPILFNERPSLKESTIQAAQFYDIQEKLCSVEEQKIQLLEKLRQYEQEIKQLRREVNCQKQKFDSLENHNTIEENNLKATIKMKNTSLVKLTSEKEQYTQKMFEMKELNSYLEEKLETVLGELQDRENQIEELRNQFQDFEKQFIKVYQKMNHQSIQKEDFLRQMQREQILLKKKHRNEINQQIKTIEELKALIEEVTKEVELSKIINDELKNQKDELEKKLCQASKEIDQFKEAVFAEYKKVKEHHEGQIIIKDHLIFQLRKDNERLNKNLVKQRENIQRLHQNIQQEKESCEKITQNILHEKENNKRLSKKILQLKEKNEKLAQSLLEEKQGNETLKAALSESFQLIEELRVDLQKKDKELKKTKSRKNSHPVEAELEYLREELLYLSQEVDIREARIKELNIQLQRTKGNQKSIKIESIQDEFNDSYICELKKTILGYQKIILSHHSVIRELQDRVYEYLKDAIDKEEEADQFHEALKNYETGMYELLAQKMSLDLENKKLKKSIKEPEKTSNFGTRFLNTPIEKIIQDSLQTDPKMKKGRKRSRNGTIKLRKEA